MDTCEFCVHARPVAQLLQPKYSDHVYCERHITWPARSSCCTQFKLAAERWLLHEATHETTAQ